MEKRELYQQHKAELAKQNGHVCVCKAVDKETIKKAVAEGANTFAAVQEATTAGTACSLCEPMIEDIIAE